MELMDTAAHITARKLQLYLENHFGDDVLEISIVVMVSDLPVQRSGLVINLNMVICFDGGQEVGGALVV
ncbi:UNVERIFIED_CONTAM: hypothetical protein FKN15_038259 [Acipenser sinensis]